MNAVPDDNRLCPPEEAFVLAEQVLDLPVINQLIWRFDTPLDAGRLETVVDRLRDGPLTRRLHRAGAPFARASWTAAPFSAPVLRIDDDIDRAELIAWADHDVRRSFRSDSGVPWTVSAAPMREGGHAVVFTAPHTISDGSGVFAAFEAAVTGDDIGRLPHDQAPRPSRSDDLRDGARQATAAVAGPVRAVRMALRKRRDSSADARPPRPGQPERPDTRPLPDAEPAAFAVAEFPASEWRGAAELRGGSANSLLTAFGIGLLEASGRIDAVDRIPVSIPVAVRRPGDRRAVATIGATMTADTGPTRYDDLRPLRNAAREAFQDATDPDRDQEDLLRLLTPTIRLMPRKLLRSMALRQPAAVLTCSNLGEVPDPVATLGGPDAGAVSARMSVQHATVEQLRTARGGLTTWLAFSGGNAVLSTLSMDPDRWPDSVSVQRAIADEAAKWSLTPRFW